MVEYRQALVRMRLGESDRQIHATGLMGRRTLSGLQKQATTHGWLDTAQPLPPDEELATVLIPVKGTRPRVNSSLEPHREQIERWFEDGVQGTTIHAALKRRHGYSGSYSAVRRFLGSLATTPDYHPDCRPLLIQIVALHQSSSGRLP